MKNSFYLSAVTQQTRIKDLNLLIAIFIFVSGIAISILTIPFGISLTDEPYQLMVMMDWKNQPATFLSGMLASLWGDTVGWDMISMRLFSRLILILSVLLPGYWMWKHTRFPGLTLAVCGVAIALTIYFGFFSWNILSKFSLVIALIWIASLIQRPNMIGWAFFGVYCALIAMLRFPNVVVLPAIVIVIFVTAISDRKWKRASIQAALFCIAFLITWVAVIMAVYGTVGNFSRLLNSTIVTNHSIWLMFESILTTSIKCAEYMVVLLIGALSIHFACRHNKKWISNAITVIYVFLLVGLMGLDRYNFYDTTPIIYALSFSVIGIIFVLMKRRKKKFDSVSALLFALIIISVIPMAGSNTGVTKIISAQFYPIIATLALPYLNNASRKFILSTLAAFLLFVPIKRWFSNFEDAGIQSAEVTLSDPMLEGVKTYSVRADQIHSFEKIIRQSKADEVIFETDGVERFMGYYISGSLPPYDANEWSPEGRLSNEALTANCLKYVDSRKGSLDIAIMKFNGSYQDAVSPLEKELMNRGGKPYCIEETTIYNFPNPKK